MTLIHFITTTFVDRVWRKKLKFLTAELKAEKKLNLFVTLVQLSAQFVGGNSIKVCIFTILAVAKLLLTEQINQKNLLVGQDGFFFDWLGGTCLFENHKIVHTNMHVNIFQHAVIWVFVIT